VGYNGIPLKGVDYSSITEVNDSVAKAGDTIQIYGNQSGNINKRLVILGFGYNLNVHPGFQSNPGLGSNETNNPSAVYITFELGSDSSIVEGCNFGGTIRSNKIIFRRCSGSITLANDKNQISDIKIISCWNINVTSFDESPGNLVFPCKNVQVINCLGTSGFDFNNSSVRINSSESTGSIINCVGVFPYGNVNSKILVKNSIFFSLVGNYANLMQYLSTNKNTLYDNNVFLDISEPTPTLPGMNNKYGQNRDSVFITGQNIDSNDENKYQLRPNSSAKNFGIDLLGKPTDCGIFGGELAYRYRIGGQPAIPAFYKLFVPTNAASTNPYNITVSVKSNN
jgi:hypothetical protein